VTADRPDFGVLLALAHVTFADELRRHMREVGFAGFTTRTGQVLRVLLVEPLSLRALADELGMSSQATLKIVAALDRDGLVERIRSPEDQRLRLVAVAERGHAALRAARGFHRQFEADLAAELGAEPVAGARRALEEVAQRAPERVPQAVRPRGPG
jgi:DNA-binding MarR family transcriptional regulator